MHMRQPLPTKLVKLLEISLTAYLPCAHAQGVKQSILSICLSAQKLPWRSGHLSDSLAQQIRQNHYRHALFCFKSLVRPMSVANTVGHNHVLSARAQPQMAQHTCIYRILNFDL